MNDETYDEHGDFLARGRCDTCGAPVDDNGCSTDRTHPVALTGCELPAIVRGPLWVRRYDEARRAEVIAVGTDILPVEPWMTAR